MFKTACFLSLLLSGQLSFAQDDEVNDSIKGYNTGAINLANPKSVVEAYTYDPITNMYVLTKTFEGFNINYPIILTPKEYEKLVLKESMHEYFKNKSKAVDGKGSEEDKKNLLPRYYVNSSFFETIFGGNTIDVKPTGSVEVDLGFRHTRQDNPSFSPRNRATTTFDFDQRISMSLMGKVGTRLNVNANYDTQSTFAFQNLIKLEYAPTEDDIIQKIEVGNVNMPLNSSLIRGAQSLFGVKAQLQFGKTTVTGVFSEQKSQTKTVTSQGGGTIQNFELFAQEYDADRHFFLSQYFKNKYDYSLRNYPQIDSRVQITRIEVWITNRQNRVTTNNNNLRNIIALQDLGETSLNESGTLTPIPASEIVAINPLDNPGNTFFLAPTDTPSNNSNNRYDPALIIPSTPPNPNYPGLLNPNIREIVTSNSGFNNSQPVSEGIDYSKLENARKLSPNEFTYHPQLGYISLQQRLANDEVLAVAYQYTIGDQVYQVGEFGNDGVEATQVDPSGVPSSQALILKMLKSSLTTVQKPIWGLMMKNIYQIPGGYQLQKEDFKFNILYTDPSPLNYITQANPASPLPADVEQTPLLKVFGVDQLNYNNDPQNGGDGFFDFYPGLTVDQQSGRIIFTSVEPFGKYLFEKLRTGLAEDYDGDPTLVYNANQAKYVFRTLYKSTQAAALQDSEKNKFQLRGKFKSSGGDGIPIGAFNVPKGSVVVTAGGRVLVEGVDYTVNYQAGRVQILDPALSASNTPIEVSVENNSVFGQQTRRFFGVNVEHKFSEKFILGATFLKMTERPFTQKSNYGQESVNNSIYGINTSYSTEVPFLTRLVNKLPNIDTDVPSVVSFRGEVAYLQPNSPKADRFEGEATIYVDDFEGSQTTIDLKSPFSWYLSSTPERPTTGVAPDYLDFGGTSNGLEYGFKRAKLAWYSIDPVFYTQRPSGISEDDLSLNSTRRIFSQELFPNTVIAQGQTQVVNTLDLTYFPNERGPYNFNTATAPDNTIPNPKDNFGGIVRALNSTNFEQSNVEYVQFWMLDPYFTGPGRPIETAPTNIGKVYLNLGEISEDVLKDGRKFYENGVGNNQIVVNPQPLWGDVPASQSLIYAFDSDPGNRTAQDVGFNGLNDSQEAAKFPTFSSFADPAVDNYTYFLNTTGNVFDRYKNYNGTEGNSPIDVTDTNRGSTTVPDVEDINRDNTMNTINAYYEYGIDVRPGMAVGNTRYVTDVRETTVTLSNGETTQARWIQFKVPVSQPENTVGSISDFRSIRFMRLFMTGFTSQVTLRFGALDLVRGEWRRFENTLDPTDTDTSDDGTDFDSQAINIQENGDRLPIHYVTPPGVQLEELYFNNTLIPQNEQSLALRVDGDGLEPGDSRAVFKNVSVDMRQFKKLKMFVHAEAPADDVVALEDDEMVAFIRFGNDFTENFYQVEIPLKKTQFGDHSPEGVWPESNRIDISTELLTKLKILALNYVYTPGEIFYRNEDDPDMNPSASGKVNKLRLGIRGNPNFGLVRTLMVGVKNQTDDLNTPQHPLNPRRIKGEVWFNELRLAEMDNKGGMAAVANLDGNLADFANVSATGRMSTIGFGTLEQGPNERSREDILQYNVVTNMSLGKLLPKKWGINLPFNYAIGEEFITPKYDPFNQDIELQQLIDVTADEAEKRNIKNRAIDYTKRKSINFIGVKKERGEKQKPHFYDPENLTLSYSYNQVDRHNYELENFTDQQVNTTADYTFAFQSKPIEPFKKVKTFKKSSYWKLLSDFNFNYLPANISFSSNIIRQFNRQQFRLVDVEGLGLDALYQRNFLFNYQYGFNYNLTKSLKLNFNATSNNIVRNYMDENNVPDNSYTIWTDYWNIGSPNQHNQQLTVNYELPLNKIPFLNFVKSSYTYTGNFSWQRSSLAFSSVISNGVEYSLGNTIQNAGSHKLNTQFNMESFYKYLGLNKTKKQTKTTQVGPPKPGQKVTSQATAPAKDSNPFVDGLIGVLTSVKNIQINYIENQGTALPGFLPSIGFFGTAKPSLGFAFGSQDDIRFEAAKNGWLTSYPEFNLNYTQILTRTLDFTANIDLFPDFKIDLSGNRTYANNFSEQYDVSSDGTYNSRSPYSTGNFAISTVMIKNAFKASDEIESSAFNDFRGNRIIIAQRLASSYYGSNTYPLDAEGYPVGFGKNSQSVLVPAFLAAYTGFGIKDHKKGESAGNVSFSPFRDIPIPNWNIKYNGLMRYKFFKDKFKRFSLQHNYKASYTINSFRSNLDYKEGVNPLNGNLYEKTLVGNVNLVEQFNPLIRLDLETKSSFKFLAEMKKDRALSLSFDNNLLTEVKGIEYVIGTGYRFKDVIFSTKLADDPSGVIKSDINLKIDFSYRNNKTIVRYLDYNNNQLGGGQNIWSARLTADYSFSKNLTAIFYYDHSFSKAVISTSFPLTNIRGGFTLRYNFGN
ncbi:cell surface protein SprA [Flavobacterium chungnamense]|uniref:T9SS outer membrane translocon Sov/SprA n=1 Tax=Flavobacterium chungnamense TaxID=706182 RepID=UPI003CD05464